MASSNGAAPHKPELFAILSFYKTAAFGNDDAESSLSQGTKNTKDTSDTFNTACYVASPLACSIVLPEAPPPPPSPPSSRQNAIATSIAAQSARSTACSQRKKEPTRPKSPIARRMSAYVPLGGASLPSAPAF
jgi:hypothetical protein